MKDFSLTGKIFERVQRSKAATEFGIHGFDNTVLALYPSLVLVNQCRDFVDVHGIMKTGVAA